jgi:hypothetical protein
MDSETKTVRTMVTNSQLVAAQGGFDASSAIDNYYMTVECPAHYDPEQITAEDILSDPAIVTVRYL